MKFTSVIIAAVVANGVVQAYPKGDSDSIPEWKAPGEGDVRCVCPMLNTLANHGYIPHNGKGLTKDLVVDVFTKILNFDKQFSIQLFGFGLKQNPVANSSTWDIDHVNRIDIDTSLTRTDAALGDPVKFNQTIFDFTKSFWPNPIITLKDAAAARLGRTAYSDTHNPEFRYPLPIVTKGVAGVYMSLFTNGTEGFAHRSLAEIFFEQERLPYIEGWVKPETPISAQSLLAYGPQLDAAGSSILLELHLN